jgi:hypothetical protein
MFVGKAWSLPYSGAIERCFTPYVNYERKKFYDIGPRTSQRGRRGARRLDRHVPEVHPVFRIRSPGSFPELKTFKQQNVQY